MLYQVYIKFYVKLNSNHASFIWMHQAILQMKLMQKYSYI